jgi:hypothetical protein
MSQDKPVGLDREWIRLAPGNRLACIGQAELKASSDSALTRIGIVYGVFPVTGATASWAAIGAAAA